MILRSAANFQVGQRAITGTWWQWGWGHQGITKKRGLRQTSKELGKEDVLGIAVTSSSLPPEMSVR